MDKIKEVLSIPTVQRDLIRLYRLSQSECTKNGKLTMEIGTSREKDLIAVLRCHLGEEVVYDIDAHGSADVRISGETFSIKHTSSCVGKGTIKWIWTADALKAQAFKNQLLSSFDNHYYSNMILVYVDTLAKKLTFVGVAKKTLIAGVQLWKEQAFVNRVGTNNRGVEFSPQLTNYILEHPAFRIVLTGVDLTSYFDPIQRRICMLLEGRK